MRNSLISTTIPLAIDPFAMAGLYAPVALLVPGLGRGGGVAGVILIVVMMALRIFMRSRRGRGGRGSRGGGGM